MRPLSRGSRLLLPVVLLLASAAVATPAPAPAPQPAPQPVPPELDDRSFSDVLEGLGNAAGNITQELGSILQSVSSLIQTFVGAVQQVENSASENDLVGLLGMDVQSAEDDQKNTPNGTVSAVGTNITCPGMAVLFARGTTEPGNVGIFTGPSFIQALRNYINGTTSLAVQGVDYPASIPGFLVGGSPSGSFVMAAIANKTAAACPDTKIVLSGYSQGAQVVHNAMELINPPSPPNTGTTTNTTTPPATPAPPATPTTSPEPATNTTTNTTADPELITKTNKFKAQEVHNFNSAAVTSKISSVVLFGDPRNGTTVAGVDAARVVSFCNTDDNICAKSGDIVTLDHLTYNRDAPAAAMFVMQKTALGVASSDATNQGMGNVPNVPVMNGMSGSMQISGNPGLPKM